MQGTQRKSWAWMLASVLLLTEATLTEIPQQDKEPVAAGA